MAVFRQAMICGSTVSSGRNVPHRANLSRMPHAPGVKPRPRHELVMRAVHPLVAPGVKLLARLGLEPWQVVVAHGVIGVVAAVLIAQPHLAAWVAAAVLLQVRTVLDNLDGALARATGRVTELGRYLDTGMDLIVNVCVFFALASHGPPVAALTALVVLTFLLSYDFNAERLYREAHGEPEGVRDDQAPAAQGAAETPAPAGAAAAQHATIADTRSRTESLALAAFRGLYDAVLAPQDRAVRALERRLLEAASGSPLAGIGAAERRAWWGLPSTATLVNLGLSTQHLVLGVCLALGRPFAYVWLVLAQGVYLVLVILVRLAVHRSRRVST